MNWRFLSVIAVVATSFFSTAKADDWVDLGKDAKGLQWFIYHQPITRDDKAVTFWVKEVLPNQKQAPNNQFYNSDVAKYIFNCKEQTYAQVSTLAYNSNTLVYQWTNSSNYTDYSPAAPDTVAATILNAACYGQQPQSAPSRAVNVSPADDVDWVLAAKSQDGKSNYYIARKFASANNGIAFLYEKELRVDSTAITDGDSQKYKTATYLLGTDCNKKLFLLSAADFYAEDGTIVRSVPLQQKEISWEKPAPNSVMSYIYDLSCSTFFPKSDAPPPLSSNTNETTGVVSGTAWLTSSGYLVTANHVVTGGTSIAVYQNGTFAGSAEIVSQDAANDVAILRPTFAARKMVGIALSDEAASLGEKVFTLGYPAPDALGLSIKLTAGEVNSLFGRDAESQRVDDPRFLQISTPIQPGNSGGPVLDRNDRAIGIVISRVQMTAEGELAQNVNYALKIGYVRDLLNTLPPIKGGHELRTSRTAKHDLNAVEGAVFLIAVKGNQ